MPITNLIHRHRQFSDGCVNSFESARARVQEALQRKSFSVQPPFILTQHIHIYVYSLWFAVVSSNIYWTDFTGKHTNKEKIKHTKIVQHFSAGRRLKDKHDGCTFNACQTMNKSQFIHSVLPDRVLDVRDGSVSDICLIHGNFNVHTFTWAQRTNVMNWLRFFCLLLFLLNVLLLCKKAVFSHTHTYTRQMLKRTLFIWLLLGFVCGVRMCIAYWE